MTLILLVIAAALIVGLLTGGSFRYFPSIPLGWWSLAIGGVVLQFLPLGGDAGFWTLVASFVLLLAFALLNIRAPGFILIFCGLLLNAIVIFANHGMPVAREALIRSGQEMTSGFRVPPRCDPTCLPHWNGVFPAQAHAVA